MQVNPEEKMKFTKKYHCFCTHRSSFEEFYYAWNTNTNDISNNIQLQ